MNRTDLLAMWERRRTEALEHGSSAPLAKTYSVVIEELKTLDSGDTSMRCVSTKEAAEILSTNQRTVAKWASAERFLGAFKTSEKGEWRIPEASVYAVAGLRCTEPVATPKLWRPEDG